MGAKKKVVRRKKKKPKKMMPGSRRQVFNGSRPKTKGGLNKGHLVRNKNGKIVSAKASAAAKIRYKKNGLDKWISAVQKVRKQMGLSGFVAIKKGTKYYNEVRKIYDASK